MAYVTSLNPPPPAPVPPAAPAPSPAPEFSSAPKRDWFRILMISAIIVFAGLFVAAPAFHGTWLWDDDQEISANFAVQGINGMGLKDIWIPGKVGADYLPVKTTFLWAEWKLFNAIGLEHDTTGGPNYQGTINIGYHVINAIFHIINALLIWNLFYRLRIRWAWLGGLLFAIHPVLVESVAWVTEQKNTLSLIFMLLSMITFINYHERGRTRDIVLSFLMFTASVLSKSAVIMLPFCLVLYLWWRDNNFKWQDILMLLAAGAVNVVVLGLTRAYMYGDWINLVYYALPGAACAAFFAFAWWSTKAEQWQYVMKYTCAMLPYFVLVTVISVITVYWQFDKAIGEELIPVGGYVSRTATAGMAVWFYLLKCIWPFALPQLEGFSSSFSYGLVPIYERWEVYHPDFMQLVVPWLAMGAVFSACVSSIITQRDWRQRDWRAYWLAITAALGASVVLSTIAYGFATSQSISWFLGALILAALFVVCLRGICKSTTWGRHVMLGLGFFLGNLVPVLGFITMSYMRITWVADHFVYISLIGVLGLVIAGAAALYDKIPSIGRPWAIGVGAAAIVALTISAMFYSNKFLNESNMWTYTLSKNPDAWQAHSRYGKVCLDNGLQDKAFYHIQNSNRLRPDLAETNNNMGVLLLQKKRGAEGLPYFRRAVRLMPIGAFLFNYANALTSAGQGAEAVPAYEKLLKMNGGGTMARHLQKHGAATLEILLRERGGITLGDLVKNNQNPALDRMLMSKGAAEYSRLLPLQGGAALREMIKLNLNESFAETLKKESGKTLELLAKNKGGKALEAEIRQRGRPGLLDDLMRLQGSDLLRDVFNMKPGNEAFFGLRKARGSDAYEALVLAMRPDPIKHLSSLSGGDKLEQLLNSGGGDMLVKLRDMENTEAHTIIIEMMGGDPVVRLQEIIATLAAQGGDVAQRLAMEGINDPSVVLTNYAAALTQAGRIDESIRAYQHAIAIRPMPETVGNLAMILTQARRAPEAVPLFDKLLQVEAFANNPAILVNAGIAFFQVGRRGDSIRLIERALQINPNMHDAQRILDQIKNAPVVAPGLNLQSAPAPVMPISAPADPSQLPIPAVFQNN